MSIVGDAKSWLQCKGFTISDHRLETREETAAFQCDHDTDSTPQIFIGGSRVGGYDEIADATIVAEQAIEAAGTSFAEGNGVPAAPGIGDVAYALRNPGGLT